MALPFFVCFYRTPLRLHPARHGKKYYECIKKEGENKEGKLGKLSEKSGLIHNHRLPKDYGNSLDSALGGGRVDFCQGGNLS